MKTKSLLLALLLYSGVSNAQKLKGSDTVLPLAQKQAENFMKANKSAAVTVTGGGSGVGISALLAGTTDIAMSSRKIEMAEKMKLNDAGKKVKETIIALDALAVVVHPSNKVSQLTREQLEDIFTGKIKNWKAVGGDDLAIVVYSRESSSGTYEFFKEHVMKKKNYASTVLSMPATGSIIQSISQTKGAIGYVGFAYVEKDVKSVKVSFDQGKSFVQPSLKTAKDKSYPISRPLYYYYLSSAEKTLKPFVDFCLSAQGQKIVEEVGYIPLTK